MARNSPRFAPDLIRNACAKGEPGAIAELADAVENALNRRNRRAEGGRSAPVVSHGEIADSLAANYAYRLVKSCHLHGRIPPAELVTLMQMVLAQNRPPRGTGARRRNDSDWLAKAAAHWHGNPGASPADLARVAGVHRSTVGKAIKSGRLRPPAVADKEVH